MCIRIRIRIVSSTIFYDLPNYIQIIHSTIVIQVQGIISTIVKCVIDFCIIETRTYDIVNKVMPSYKDFLHLLLKCNNASKYP